MTVIIAGLSFLDHTELLAPLTLVSCSAVFNNVLGHRILQRLVKSNWDSLKGQFLRSEFDICPYQEISSQLALSLFLSIEKRTTTNSQAAFIINESIDLFQIAFHHNLLCFPGVFRHELHWRRKWQPTPVFLPGESQGWGSLVGCHLWGRTESDTTEATQQQQQQLGMNLSVLHCN